METNNPQNNNANQQATTDQNNQNSQQNNNANTETQTDTLDLTNWHQDYMDNKAAQEKLAAEEAAKKQAEEQAANQQNQNAQQQNNQQQQLNTHNSLEPFLEQIKNHGIAYDFGQNQDNTAKAEGLAGYIKSLEKFKTDHAKASAEVKLTGLTDEQLAIQLAVENKKIKDPMEYYDYRAALDSYMYYKDGNPVTPDDEVVYADLLVNGLSQQEATDELSSMSVNQIKVEAKKLRAERFNEISQFLKELENDALTKRTAQQHEQALRAEQESMAVKNALEQMKDLYGMPIDNVIKQEAIAKYSDNFLFSPPRS